MKKITLILFLAIATISCNKLDIEKGTPRCIKKKIKDINDKTTCSGTKVDEYTFQGNTVYAFENGFCGGERTTLIFDSDCKVIGNMGGLTGNTQVNGESFSNATFIKTIWEK